MNEIYKILDAMHLADVIRLLPEIEEYVVDRAKVEHSKLMCSINGKRLDADFLENFIKSKANT